MKRLFFVILVFAQLSVKAPKCYCIDGYRMEVDDCESCDCALTCCGYHQGIDVCEEEVYY